MLLTTYASDVADFITMWSIRLTQAETDSDEQTYDQLILRNGVQVLRCHCIAIVISRGLVLSKPPDTSRRNAALTGVF